MSEMVERVAKALFEKGPKNNKPAPGWVFLTEDWKAAFCATARVAIEAMREPGDAILGYVKEGSAPPNGANDFNDWANHYYDPAGFWNALIDEALREKKEC